MVPLKRFLKSNVELDTSLLFAASINVLERSFKSEFSPALSKLHYSQQYCAGIHVIMQLFEEYQEFSF